MTCNLVGLLLILKLSLESNPKTNPKLGDESNKTCNKNKAYENVSKLLIHILIFSQTFISRFT